MEGAIYTIWLADFPADAEGAVSVAANDFRDGIACSMNGCEKGLTSFVCGYE